MNPTSTRHHRCERGSALVATLLILVLMLSMGTAAQLYSVFDLRSTTHYATGNQAFYAAESGILRALNTINTMGVVDFNTDVVQRWNTVFTPNPQTLPGFGQFAYSVTVAADPLQPAARGVITANGTAPANSSRVLRAAVKRNAGSDGRGAIYLAADAVDTRFTGNAFEVNGNDHDQFGGLVPGGIVEPGIATRNDTVTSGVKNSLNDQQKDNVLGLDFTLVPLNPSVVTVNGPSVADLDRIVDQILTRNPNVVNVGNSNINGNVTFGTVANPQITRMTASEVKLHANGNASGAGILIVDGSIIINGTLDFVGWIIVLGDTVINGSGGAGQGTGGIDETTVQGSATILGSLWTGDLSVRVGGSAIVDYCQFCMTLADGAGVGGNIPGTMQVVYWEEVL